MMFVFSLSFKHIWPGSSAICAFSRSMMFAHLSFSNYPAGCQYLPPPLPFNQRAWYQPTTFPLPPLVSFSSPGSPLNHSCFPPFSLSSFQWMHNPRSARSVLGGGVQGTHTPTPHLQKNKRPSQGVIKTELTMETEANPAWLGQKARALKPA